MNDQQSQTIVIGAGIIGISAAYYLKKAEPNQNVTLIDAGQPMAFTSAQSGENYRNWWPHPIMKAFTNHSIDLAENIARQTDNRINMNRRGYILATRSSDIDELMNDLYAGYGDDSGNRIRIHNQAHSESYSPPLKEDWETAPSGVDVLQNSSLIQSHFAWYERDIKSIIHIRRAGDLSGQQLGQFMLEEFRSLGGRRIQAKVTAIDHSKGYMVHLDEGLDRIKGDRIVNAAGPFVNEIAQMLGETLPVHNVLHQKIAFEDKLGVIPRRMPFSIDLDRQVIDWTPEELEWMADETEMAQYLKEMPGGIHCRPDGGDRGNWVKLGWAFNCERSDVSLEPEFSDTFPEIVLRGAARLNPRLKQYYGHLPRNMTHYGGYYTMTDENWPLIGPMKSENAFIVGAMSGFGTMSACAAGELCTQWMTGAEMPDYAASLSSQRYQNEGLMAEIKAGSSRSIL